MPTKIITILELITLFRNKDVNLLQRLKKIDIDIYPWFESLLTTHANGVYKSATKQVTKDYKWQTTPKYWKKNVPLFRGEDSNIEDKPEWLKGVIQSFTTPWKNVANVYAHNGTIVTYTSKINRPFMYFEDRCGIEIYHFAQYLFNIIVLQPIGLWVEEDDLMYWMTNAMRYKYSFPADIIAMLIKAKNSNIIDRFLNFYDGLWLGIGLGGRTTQSTSELVIFHGPTWKITNGRNVEDNFDPSEGSIIGDSECW